jgi:hypothetical protein
VWKIEKDKSEMKTKTSGEMERKDEDGKNREES